MQQRDSIKKSAASVAITLGSSGGRAIDVLGSAEEVLEVQGNGNPVAKTASWLDRAKNLLREPSGDGSTVDQQAQELENQLLEVQRLIHEGPIIQQTSQELPQILETHPHDGTEAVDRGNVTTSNVITENEPADKRLRTAEDAEALVGFLRSVRATAAQSGTF